MTVRLQLGDARLACVEDFVGLGYHPAEMFPAWQPDMWRTQADWAVPGFYDPQADRLRTSMHSWVVFTGRHTVLIDTCIGNHKERPSVPHFHRRNGQWLANLAQAGVQPEQVDYVMCTHLHADHVGWNTRLHDGRWVPTFPNARYLFGRIEYQRWDPRRPGHDPRPINQFVFEDSLLPVEAAGQMVLVDDGHTVDELLTVEATPGHTPGHAQIRLASRGRHGLFSGDIIHHPFQVPYPQLRSQFDEAPDQAARVRERLLAECAERGAVLMPSHFAGSHHCTVHAQAAGFVLEWGAGV